MGVKMKVGIISDSHDNIWNLDKAILELKEKVQHIIHCGDFCAPFVMKHLEKSGLPVHCVFGNTSDEFSTKKVADSTKNVKLYGNLAEFELDDKKIVVNHYPYIAKALALTGKYDFVFFGHNHKQSVEKVNNTVVVNPGEIMGRFGTPTYAIVDLDSGDTEFFEVKQ